MCSFVLSISPPFSENSFCMCIISISVWLALWLSVENHQMCVVAFTVFKNMYSFGFLLKIMIPWPFFFLPLLKKCYHWVQWPEWKLRRNNICNCIDLVHVFFFLIYNFLLLLFFFFFWWYFSLILHTSISCVLGTEAASNSVFNLITAKKEKCYQRLCLLHLSRTTRFTNRIKEQTKLLSLVFP